MSNPPKLGVWFEDGDGDFVVAATPTAGVSYTFVAHAATYSIAIGCSLHEPATPISGAFSYDDVMIVRLAVADRTELSVPTPIVCPLASGPTGYPISGTVSNIASPDPIEVYSDDYEIPVYVASGSTSGTYSLATNPGTHDLLVGQYVQDWRYAFMAMNAASIQRGLTTTGGPVTQDLDFSMAGMQLRSIPGSGAASSVLHTASGTNVLLSTIDWRALPTAQAAPDDLYDFTLEGYFDQPYYADYAASNTSSSLWSASVAVPMAPSPGWGVAKDAYPTASWVYPDAVGYSVHCEQGYFACNGTETCKVAQSAFVAASTVDASYQVPNGIGKPFTSGVPISCQLNAYTSTAGPQEFPFTLVETGLGSWDGSNYYGHLPTLRAAEGTVRTVVTERF